MLELIKNVLRDLRNGENVELYLTIVVAAVIAVLGLFSVANFQLLSAAILAVLALMAGSLISNRRNVADVKGAAEKLNGEIQKLHVELHEIGQSPLPIYSEYPDLTKQIRTAKRINILGMSLVKITANYYDDLEQALQRGARVRSIISDPSPEVVSAILFRNYMINDPTHMTEVIYNHLMVMKRLRQVCADQDTCSSRTIPFVIPYGLVIIENPIGISRAYVRIMSFRAPPGRSPVLEFDSKNNRDWYQFFLDQYEKFWEASKDSV